MCTSAEGISSPIESPSRRGRVITHPAVTLSVICVAKGSAIYKYREQLGDSNPSLNKRCQLQLEAILFPQGDYADALTLFVNFSACFCSASVGGWSKTIAPAGGPSAVGTTGASSTDSVSFAEAKVSVEPRVLSVGERVDEAPTKPGAGLTDRFCMPACRSSD